MGVLSFIPFLLSQGFFRRQSKPVQAFGPHSFKSLGSSFYVEVPVRRVPGARLVLFNRRLAESLDLPVPKGGREIESALLEWFAWFKHESRAGEGDTPAEDIETFFATRYQDSDSRCAGSALGDGRALWLGEIVRKTADDRMRYLDVVVKGIGATPLAWLKHPKKSHRDGMVGLTEAVHEYVYSLAAVRNGIDAAQVLAVIELPFQRAAGGEKAALVVRVGNHLRFAHYRYFSNQPERLETLFEYGLKRDMGLPLDYPVGRQDARATWIASSPISPKKRRLTTTCTPCTDRPPSATAHRTGPASTFPPSFIWTPITPSTATCRAAAIPWAAGGGSTSNCSCCSAI